MVASNGRQSEGRANNTIKLSRTLGLFTVTMMGVGGMIGAGIFALTGIAAGEAGPAVIVVFVLNGLITLLTALAYAELGSTFPRAGGGYVWVKEGLGGTNGFLAGWMSWFGYVVAGALYGIAFGGFAANAWVSAGLPMLGLAEPHFAIGFTIFIIFVLSAFNYFGAEEVGVMGNVITLAKIVILGLFIAFGLAQMLGSTGWEPKFTANFMPNGISGIFIAMGITFIAFEGYEIIAQSGEEVIDPKRNIPRGIFISVFIAVVIYILVGIVAIGATTPPAGVPVYAFLGQQKELAIVSIARQIFPFGTGGVLMLISGLAATMSALNVTIYSAARVSFAMGREHNLPEAFANIHPRRLTPYVAVIATGGLMLVASLALPLETTAVAGGIMFLLMFIQVNLALMTLRVSKPEARRGFSVPFFPLLNVIAIVANAALVLYMVTFSHTAIWIAFGWIVLGMLAYYMYFERQEKQEKPKEVMLEETVGNFDYTVLIGVRNERESRVLGRFGAAIAKANDGGVMAVHMLEVPLPLGLNEGRMMLNKGQRFFRRVADAASSLKIGVNKLIMITRRAAPAIADIARERRVGLIVLHTTGETKRGRTFGRTIDPLLGNPPANIALVRPARKPCDGVHSILVPVDSGPNSHLAIKLATDIGRAEGGRKAPMITLLRVVKTKTELDAGWDESFAELLEGIDYKQIETWVLQGTSITNTVLEEAENSDLMIFGASQEPLLKRIVAGSISRRLLRGSKPETVMVKRRQRALHSLLRRTGLAAEAKG